MPDAATPISSIAQSRKSFHADLIKRGILRIGEDKVPSNADKDSKKSVALALGVATRLEAEVGTRLKGQTAGSLFEVACSEFLKATFPLFEHLRPGPWEIEQIKGRTSVRAIAKYDQYSHLLDLEKAVDANKQLQTILGNAYDISPDVVISRNPFSDEQINESVVLVDDTVSGLSSLRSSNHALPTLHAVVSCKWTFRSDRAQNARSEALNLIRNRKGRLPHIVVVTGEPLPSRLSSLALGTGDIDCVYHFALPELISSMAEMAVGDEQDLLQTMVNGKRLRDIADLPLDLAV